MKPREFLASTAILAVSTSAGNCQAAATLHVPAQFSSIQAAINAAQSGDTVLVASGTYSERLDFMNKSIALISESGAAATTIDGQLLGTVIKVGSGSGSVFAIEGFTIARGRAYFGSGISLYGASPRIAGNVFLNNAQISGGTGTAIDVNGGSPTIEGNEFVGNTCDSQYASGVITLGNGSSPRIYNNTFHDNNCRAIDVSVPVDAAPVVFNNTIVRNRVGISIALSLSNANQSYRNNIVVANSTGLEIASQSTPLDAAWTNNLVFGNATQYAGTTDLTGQNQNIAADPVFVNSAIGNFRLSAGSPAIDAGTSTGLSLPAFDFDGGSRVEDGDGNGTYLIDIGAFEAATTVGVLFTDGFE